MNVLAALRRLATPARAIRPVHIAKDNFRVALHALTELHRDAQARDDKPSMRYYALAVHALLGPSGAEWSKEEWPGEEDIRSLDGRLIVEPQVSNVIGVRVIR